MEVHPPEHAIHSWRDFFVHIATIVVGLLIAVGLEQSVEALHRRHTLHRADENIRAEITANHKLMRDDLKELEHARTQNLHNLALLRAERAHPGAGTEELTFGWTWNGTSEAAWTTARETAALALMSYERAQTLGMTYGQQQVVDNQATIYIAGVYRSGASMAGGRKLQELTPAELDRMIAATEQTIADIALLKDLSRGLMGIYDNVDGKL